MISLKPNWMQEAEAEKMKSAHSNPDLRDTASSFTHGFYSNPIAV